MRNEALLFRKSLTRTYVSIKHVSEYPHKHIYSVFFVAAFVVVFITAPPPGAAWPDWLYDPKCSKNVSWAYSTACQQKRRPRIQCWLLGQCCHKRGSQEAERAFFIGGGGCYFIEVLDLKSLGSQRWLASYLKNFSVTITDKIHISFCMVPVSALTPAAVRIFSITTFASTAS